MTPEFIFIIPYRNREKQKNIFEEKMKIVLEDISEDKYKIFFIHQKDERDFNRGAMKNIGFLYVKSIYPEHYKDITLVFNDIDTVPNSKNMFDYSTTQGTIKHFYGCQIALGGIFSINAADFEYINGFPNFWTWGYEDNLIQERALICNFKIDRSNFYSLMDKNINHDFSDGYFRDVNKNDYLLYLNKTSNGIHSISQLSYEFDPDSHFVNVTQFQVPNVKSATQKMDLRITNTPFQSIKNCSMPMHFFS